MAIEIDAHQISREKGEHETIAARAISKRKVAEVRTRIISVVVFLCVIVIVKRCGVERIEEQLRTFIAHIARLRTRLKLEQFAATTAVNRDDATELR